MNTSKQFIAFLLLLGLAAMAWSQDEEEQDAQAVPQEAIETVSEGMPDEADLQEQAEAVADDPASASEADDAAAAAQESAESDDEPATEETAGDAAGDAAEARATDEPGAGAEAPAAGAAATFVFQGHPIFTPEQAELVYRPLVDYLNDALPYRFELALAPDYHRYWLSIRRGQNPHLVLEEPHLVAFRMQRHDFTPLVRASDPITYSLLTSMGSEDVSTEDFIGRRVSSMPAPSLGYLVLANWFDNPMQQPIIQSNASSWLDAVEIVFAMAADAAIVPNNLASRYVNMMNVRTSREFPGVTVAASPEVPAEIQEEIRQALLRVHDDEEHFVAVHELDVERFVPAEPAEYEGLDDWLGLVYTIL